MGAGEEEEKKMKQTIMGKDGRRGEQMALGGT